MECPEDHLLLLLCALGEDVPVLGVSALAKVPNLEPTFELSPCRSSFCTHDYLLLPIPPSVIPDIDYERRDEDNDAPNSGEYLFHHHLFLASARRTQRDASIFSISSI